MSELQEQPRLPHSWIADHAHDLAMALDRLLERGPELFQLGVPAHEAREPALRCGLEPCAGHTGAYEFVHLDRLAQALHGDRAERLDRHVPLGQRERVARDQDTSGRRQLLHSRRQMGGLAHRGVIHVEVVPDGPHDDLARVQPDANLDLDALRAAELLRVVPHGILHAQGRVARPHRVILVSQRGPEERHDPVAHHLVHRALVAVDRLHHALEHGVEQLARLLGIAVSEKLHRALEIREEDGHLLALALQCGLGGEDLLGEVLRRIRVRSGELRGRGQSGAARRTDRRTCSRADWPRHRTDRWRLAGRRTAHRTSCRWDSHAGTGDTSCRGNLQMG